MPKRTIQHKIESRSLNIFKSKMPDSWVIREMSERDYGLDLLIEFSDEDEEMSGEFCAVQLKGKSELKWTQKNTFNFTGIKKSTSQYWFKLNVPTVLIVVDVMTEDIYYKFVNDYIIKNYTAFSEKKIFNYHLSKEDIFSDSVLFRNEFKKELQRNDYELFFMDIIKIPPSLKTFIESNYGRDEHMVIDDYDYDTNRFDVIDNISRYLKSFCFIFGIEWNLTPLRELQYEIPLGGEFREYHVTIYLRNIDELLMRVITKAKNIICVEEEGYWNFKYKSFFDQLNSYNNTSLIEELINTWMNRRLQ